MAMKRPSDKNASSVREEGRRLKMKDLTAATGLTKSTITHYIHEGLLPEPLRVYRNMAYYDPGCVERIAFIKELQSKHRLPLSAIKRILQMRDKGREVAPFIEIQDILVGLRDSQRIDLQAFCQATGLSPQVVDECIAERLLLPIEEGFFDSEDVALGRLLYQSGNLGLTLKDAAFYPRWAQKIVQEELALRERFTAQMPLEQKMAVTLDLTRVARSLRAYVIDRLFQLQIMTRRDSEIPEPLQKKPDLKKNKEKRRKRV